MKYPAKLMQAYTWKNITFVRWLKDIIDLPVRQGGITRLYFYILY